MRLRTGLLAALLSCATPCLLSGQTMSNGAGGTAASKNIGTSGASVPLLNGNNTWSGSIAFPVRQVAGTSDPSQASDVTRAWTGTAATKTANIPTCSSTVNAGRVLVDVDESGTASVSNPINITPPSGTTFQGSSAAYPMTTARQALMYQCDSVSNWMII